jgi:hypothetical protein
VSGVELAKISIPVAVDSVDLLDDNRLVEICSSKIRDFYHVIFSIIAAIALGLTIAGVGIGVGLVLALVPVVVFIAIRISGALTINMYSGR